MKMLTSAKATFIALAALALAGCSSYSEIARWNSAVKVNDGETPMATFLTQNFSYQLLWCIPICTGVPWSKEQGGGDCMDETASDRVGSRMSSPRRTTARRGASSS